MSRIPMKGDSPSIEQIVEKFGDPADSLARSYFSALQMAKAVAEEDPKKAAELMKLAERAHRTLEQYGKKPVMVSGEPKAEAI